MTASPHFPGWRPIVLALILAYLLADLLLGAGDLAGASDDLVPQWALAHLAATGRRADAYDFDTQVDFLKSLNLPAHRLRGLDQPHMKGIGVCPYPPTFAVLYAPICRLPFDLAALIVYFGSIGLALLAAWAIGDATGGRLSGLPAALVLPVAGSVQSLLAFGQCPWPIIALGLVGLVVASAWAFGQLSGRWSSALTAAIVILCYPGTVYALRLGQNSLLTLALWALGWRELVRRRDVLAGLWWGLLAYKIHWLLAVGWVPLVIGRPRVLLGMAATAGALALAATALLGPEAWGRWLAQVAAIDHVYAFDPEFREQLLPLGCDLRSLSMRYLPVGVGRFAGWAAIAAVILGTAVWYRRRPAADPAGSEGPGLLFASGLTAAHLYYYDETVFLLPLLVLWSYRPTLAWWKFVTLIGLTVVYYWAIRYLQDWSGAWKGPPVWTLVVVALWLFSLCAVSDAPPDRLRGAPLNE
jgi:Glycosyltransferase family 87